MAEITAERSLEEVSNGTTLGHLRLRHLETNEIILIPTPSKDPSDPLNWSKACRVYLALLVSLAMFFCNFLAAGPTVAIVNITQNFFGPPGPTFAKHIAKVAYFFTTTSLLQGTGNLIWMPLLIKYGRRPVYIVTFTCYTAMAAWCGGATSYASELAARILLGLFAGAGECIGPVTITDIFFVHERGTFMAIYTAALSAGVSGGIVLSGLITINLSWRYIYWIATALIGALTILVVFTMPETAFNRYTAPVDPIAGGTGLTKDTNSEDHELAKPSQTTATKIETASEDQTAIQEIKPKHSYLQALRLVHGTYTQDSLLKMFLRPIVLLSLPPVLWATLVMSVTIGFLVAISSNFDSAFSTCFGFLLSFYTNPWVDESGYSHAFGTMAGISAVIQVLWILFFFYGKSIRHMTIGWKVMRYVGWDPDREVGE
ncbi:MAG: hypothetical protein M1821_006084 [Bathelium mastoideum]|nr:MAG: hypothetical protein M1821_006084 [Bathelium mastoideum]